MAIKFRLPPGKLPAGAKWGPPPQPEAPKDKSPLQSPTKLSKKGISFYLPIGIPPANPNAPPPPPCLAMREPDNFLELFPRELRDMIYYYIVDEQPFGNFGKTNTCAEKNALHLRKWYSLLLVCHQTYDEFAPLLFQASHFTFNLGFHVNVHSVAKNGQIWQISQTLRQNLQECSLKAEVCAYKQDVPNRY
jgi:hypothetical protein